jgi:serine/threonine-protein kinase
MRFGDYVLLERVAVGGMAEVFRARLAREGGVQRQVCIKRVHPKHSADASFSAMFIDEARIGVTLSHGNIVPIFDFGCVDGLYYLAMEYVEGRDLAQIAGRARIAQKTWPTEVAILVALEILEGLDYAHERHDESGRPLHIVHRDISPANVLCSKRGEVKILDFGIARAESRELETRTGVIKGTPGYMAPEQAAGRRPDKRADVYAAGVILWELMQGRRAPKDSSPMEPLEDPDLWDVLRKGVALEPEDRWASARDMAAALRGLLAARGQHPSGRELATFVDEVWKAPAAADDWRYQTAEPGEGAEGDLGAVAPPAVRSAVATAPERPGAAAELSLRSTVPATENVGTAAPSPTGFAQRVRGDGRRGALLWLALGALAIVGIALAASGPEPRRAPRPAPTPTRAVGAATIVTVPPGAIATLEDGRFDETPARFEGLASGPHRVRIEKEGYERLDRGLVILAGENATLELPLSPRRATLRVEATPPGGGVTLDGRARGTSPAVLAGLEPERSLRLEITLDGHEPFVEDIVLARGEERAITPRLRALGRGTLAVNVSDWAEVFLDGQSIGTTPLRDVSVAAGHHRLELRNPQRNLEKRLTIVIHPHQVTRVSPW